MKKTIQTILSLLVILTSVNVVNADQYIKVEEVNINSFGGLYPSSEDIYPGSILKYEINLSIERQLNISQQEFQVIITNPSKEIISNETFQYKDEFGTNYSINSSAIKEGEWKLIYADVPGIYKLVLKSKSGIQLYENKTSAFRHDYSLPFFFEVKNLQEKRLHDANERFIDANEKLIKRNEELAKQSEIINQKILDYTKNIYWATLAMFV